MVITITSGGASAPPNVRLGPEQSVTSGLNQRNLLLGAAQVLFPPSIQLDVLNPTHMFMITHVEVIVADVVPTATLMELGCFGVDAVIPVTVAQKFIGRSIPFIPLQNTTHKIAINTDVVIKGAEFVVPYVVHNANITLRCPNAGASIVRLFGKAISTAWEKEEVIAWINSTSGMFLTIFFRRIVA